MGRKLHFVTVSYFDDNFGDMAIQVCFQALLEAALSNSRVTKDEYTITAMHLKQVDIQLLEKSDAIFFAGGWLFGSSYLGFSEHLKAIVDIAERCSIPVIFSSMGLNNMDDAEAGAAAITQILQKECVKAVSVRENLALFRELSAGTGLDIRQVADPAVWAKYVYGMEHAAPGDAFGINIVRGGLFIANGREWKLKDEMHYVSGLFKFASDADYKIKLYTNGSLDDNKTLRYFAEESGANDSQYTLPQTTSDVVRAISGCSSIAAIRLHSAIIAYSFGIPTVALEWNDKLPHFYEAIGHPERLLPAGDWRPEVAFELLQRAGGAPRFDHKYESYLMSTYLFIYRALCEQVLKIGSGLSPAFTFGEVADAISNYALRSNFDEIDLRLKMEKAERAHFRMFVNERERQKQIKDLGRRLDAQQRELELRLSSRVMRRLKLVGRGVPRN